MGKFALAVYLALGAALGALALPDRAGADSLRILELQPSKVDPSVANFDDPSYVIVNPVAPTGVPLVVFLTGTNSKPRGAIRFLSVIATQGYRVIGLEYDDSPAVAQLCPQDPDPACSESFRRMRVSGEGTSRTISNPPPEGIIQRLVNALRALDRSFPGEGWGLYLSNSQPAWNRIIVSGLSQGAGMAAFIAKQHEVARVDAHALRDRIEPHVILLGGDETRVERLGRDLERRDVVGLERMMIGKRLLPDDRGARCGERRKKLFRPTDAGKSEHALALKR